MSFTICNLLMFNYESLIFNKLTSYVSIIGYSALIFHITKRTSIKKVDPYILVFFGFLIILNLYCLYVIMHTVSYKMIDVSQEITHYIYGLFIIFSCIVAACHSFTQNTKKSMQLLIVVLALSLMDLFSFLAYYYDWNILFYYDRAFHIIASLFIVKYTIKLSEREENVKIE
ncbi:hypothetical protein ACFFU1_03490 [Algibacter miyuki]|uniref:Uncharacterized protein n=1 Tax=Algibacter miyuki TaxID=1306933 RepID=A0ABV5GWS2_9FLAO|nr:hypothetical protein [Algibacter miyuki]MDN3665280.1 hypothetical protein [Algibacter miyuki]